MNSDSKKDSSLSPSLNPRLYALFWVVVIIGFLTFALSYYLSSSQPQLAHKIEDSLTRTLFPEMCSRETLLRDYKEVFATPFSKVEVMEYRNSKAGHGLLFAITLKSTCPLQVKDPENYKTLALDSPYVHYRSGHWFLKEYPWIATCLYKQNPEPVLASYHGTLYELKAGQLIDPGSAPTQVWVYLSQFKNVCTVIARWNR